MCKTSIGVNTFNNDQTYFVVAPNCRDLKPTPGLTRFNSDDGTTTMNDKGFWIHWSGKMPDDVSPASVCSPEANADGPASNTVAALATIGGMDRVCR